MKKNILSLVLCTFLIFSLSLPAFASDWGAYDGNMVLSPTGDTLVETNSNTTSETLSPTDEVIDSNITIPGRDSLIDTSEAAKIRDGYIDVMPVVTTNDIVDWAVRKGNEIIYLLQIICQPFAIIIFIIAAFKALIGVVGKSDLIGKGLFGMVIACVGYAGAVYPPIILQTFVGWVAC